VIKWQHCFINLNAQNIYCSMNHSFIL
jgi:hypothetical protein